MDFDANKWSNDDLYSALKNLGIDTGPVTETTRAVYIKKLQTLLQGPESSSSPTRTCRLTGDKSPIQLGSDSSCSYSTVEVSSAHLSENGFVHCSEVPSHGHGRTELLGSYHHSIPQPIRNAALSTAPSAPPPLPCSSTSAQEIVDRLVQTFDDSNHVVNDTVFFFSGGDAVFASRSVLASQCQHLIPLLYNSEDVFPVRVSSLSGQALDYLVREQELVMDLKEKIYLRQGLRVEQQRLVYRQKELLDSDTLHNCGVELGATLHLVVAGTLVDADRSTYSCVSCYPALSIHHLHLNLHPELLLQQSRPSSPRHTRLAPPLSHIVHVHEGHYSGFKLFLQYLYSNDLHVDRTTPETSVVETYMVCWTLGEFFQVPSLVQACRTTMGPLLTADKAHIISTYADTVKSNTLKDFAQNYITHQITS